jgi:hypothetical protein
VDVYEEESAVDVEEKSRRKGEIVQIEIAIVKHA